MQMGKTIGEGTFGKGKVVAAPGELLRIGTVVRKGTHKITGIKASM